MDLTIRPMSAADIPAAKDILDRAFHDQTVKMTGRGRLPFFGDRLLAQRLASDPDGTLVAVSGGSVVGAIGSARWGSLAWFGPLGVDPERQGAGIGRSLVAAWIEVQNRRGAHLFGLETWAQSGGHISLYGSLGFRPLWLSAALSRPVAAGPVQRPKGVRRYSSLSPSEQTTALADLRDVASRFYTGMDWTSEIAGTIAAGAGDALILTDEDRATGLAVCQVDTLSGDPGRFFISLLAVDPAAGARAGILHLITGADWLAATLGRARIAARVCTRYELAHARLRQMGFRDDGSMLRLKLGPHTDFERTDHILLDSWL